MRRMLNLRHYKHDQSTKKSETTDHEGTESCSKAKTFSCVTERNPRTRTATRSSVSTATTCERADARDDTAQTHCTQKRPRQECESTGFAGEQEGSSEEFRLWIGFHGFHEVRLCTYEQVILR